MSLKSETNEIYLYTETFCVCLIPMTEVFLIRGFRKDVEKVQVQYLKSLLGVKSTTNCAVVYFETGRFPMEVVRLNFYVLIRFLSD